MSRNQRLTFLGIAALIAVVAVVLLSGGSGNEPASEPTAASAPAATETPTPESEGMAEPEEETPTATPSPEPTPEPLPLLEPGSRTTVEGKQGEVVRFRIRADRNEEMHLHGYDIYRDLTAGRAVTVRVDAELAGIFEIELHGSGEQVGSLKIEP